MKTEHSLNPSDTETAIRHIAAAINGEFETLSSLRRFSDENEAIFQIVQELPQKVSHRIMVPFGKAAFFPGQLVHTNEFTLHLGEQYYAKRSATQTLEFLERRREYLRSKMAAVEARIKNLKAEAVFAERTAREASEGIVEITEDYEEGMAWARAARAKSGHGRDVQVGGDEERQTNGGEEDAEEEERIMARIRELELAEEAHNQSLGSRKQESNECLPFSQRQIEESTDSHNSKPRSSNVRSVRFAEDSTEKQESYATPSSGSHELQQGSSRTAITPKQIQKYGAVPSSAQKLAFPGVVLERPAGLQVGESLEPGTKECFVVFLYFSTSKSNQKVTRFHFCSLCRKDKRLRNVYPNSKSKYEMSYEKKVFTL